VPAEKLSPGSGKELHMKNKKLIMILSVALALVLIAGVSAYAATNYGSSSDPLITLSYLNDTFTPSIVSKFQTQIDTALAGQTGGATATTYKVVTLSKGQKLTGSVGCEIMLRVGSASAQGSDTPCLVDTTGGTSLSSGSALTANHLYMVTIANNGITATAATVKVLVRGSYTIS
jgi:hypothetical protein